jgi:hypothetical protein
LGYKDDLVEHLREVIQGHKEVPNNLESNHNNFVDGV